MNDVDEIIRAAITEVGAERPSADFTARLRLEIERLPQRPPVAWRVPALAAAGTVAVAIAIVVALNVPRGYEAPAYTSQRDIALAAEPPPAAAFDRPATVRKAAPRAPRVQTSSAGGASVLVPRRERQAVDRLFASLRAGRPDVVSALGRLGAGGVDDVAESIVPIRIEAVAVPVIPAAAPVFDR